MGIPKKFISRPPLRHPFVSTSSILRHSLSGNLWPRCPRNQVDILYSPSFLHSPTPQSYLQPCQTSCRVLCSPLPLFSGDSVELSSRVSLPPSHCPFLSSIKIQRLFLPGNMMVMLACCGIFVCCVNIYCYGWFNKELCDQ